MLDFPTQQQIIGKLLKNPANHQCADCSTISPTWASLDFGVFLCANCSGGHRALGPTRTRVKSINLDLWHKDWLSTMQLGNTKINQYCKPNVGASLQTVNRYVVDKYVKKRFIKDDATYDPVTALKMGLMVTEKNQSKQNNCHQGRNVSVNIVKKETIKQLTDNKGKQCQDLLGFETDDTPVKTYQPQHNTTEMDLLQGQTLYTSTKQDEQQFAEYACASQPVPILKPPSNDNFISFDHLLKQSSQQKQPTLSHLPNHQTLPIHPIHPIQTSLSHMSTLHNPNTHPNIFMNNHNLSYTTPQYLPTLNQTHLYQHPSNNNTIQQTPFIQSHPMTYHTPYQSPAIPIPGNSFNSHSFWQ